MLDKGMKRGYASDPGRGTLLRKRVGRPAASLGIEPKPLPDITAGRHSIRDSWFYALDCRVPPGRNHSEFLNNDRTYPCLMAN